MKGIVLKSVLIVMFLIPTGIVIGHGSDKKDESRISVVVIDPGHGGKDPGAVIGSWKEKDIVLDIALKLGDLIQTAFPDVKVIYTRSKDVFIPLHKRAEIANRNEADLFISIHTNAVDARSVQGAETFVLGLHRSDDNLEVAKKENAVILLEDDYNTTYEGFDPNSPESYIMFELVQDEYLEQSVLFASEIQREFRVHANRNDRSVKQAGFLVLRQTAMPGVLIETGFLSHSGERRYLVSESGKSSLASAIFNAFQTYKKEVESNSSFNLMTETTLTPLSESETNGQANNTPPDIPDQPAPEIVFSVQVMALKQKLEPGSKHFKGEESIFRIDDKTISRYFSGRFGTLEEANAEKERIAKKFRNAFVVAFENDKLISVKKALEKM